jgi:hypothetical protein
MSAVDRIWRTSVVPCVFLSGAPLQPNRAAVAVLLKPFREEELASAIESMVQSSDTPEPDRPNCIEPPLRS